MQFHGVVLCNIMIFNVFNIACGYNVCRLGTNDPTAFLGKACVMFNGETPTDKFKVFLLQQLAIDKKEGIVIDVGANLGQSVPFISKLLARTLKLT